MDAQLVSILVFLAIGAVAGWIAGTAYERWRIRSLGQYHHRYCGLIIGGFLFGRFISGGLIGAIVTATLGAVVLLAVVKLLKKI